MFSWRLNHTSGIGNWVGLRWCVTGQPKLGCRYTLKVHTAATINVSCTEVSSRRTLQSGSHVLVRISPVDCGHATDAYPPRTAVHQKPSPLARAVAASRDPGALQGAPPFKMPRNRSRSDTVDVAYVEQRDGRPCADRRCQVATRDTN